MSRDSILMQITDRYPLTRKGSSKETFHISLKLPSKASHKVGDAIAIFPENCPLHVDRILSLLPFSSSDIIYETKTNRPYPLSTFLRKKVNLDKIRSSLLRFIDHKTNDPFIRDLLQSDNKNLLNSYLQEWDLLTWLSKIPMPLSPQEFVAHLLPLLPRFYSIASSPLQFSNQMDIVVSHISYEKNEKIKTGIASHFLCYIAELHKTSIQGYIQPTKHFTLPSDPTKDIIMIGPGTGIAPYKGFLEERICLQAPGKNWLFFGERNKNYDFFYQEFLESCIARGYLILDAAFSRDQKEKLYVQHHMEKESKEITEWIDNGAYVYVCGDAKKMAPSVEATLQSILVKEKKLSLTDAISYLKFLRKEKRYLLDVY